MWEKQHSAVSTQPSVVPIRATNDGMPHVSRISKRGIPRPSNPWAFPSLLQPIVSVTAVFGTCQK